MAILLGRTSAGTTADFIGVGDTALWNFTAILSGQLRTIYGKTKASTNTTVTAVRMGIYDDVAGKPVNLLGVASVDGLGVARGTGLFSATLTTPVNIVAGTVYWLGWKAATANFNFQGDTVAGAYQETPGAADFQNPWTTVPNTGNTTAIIWGESVDSPWPLVIPNKFVGPMAKRHSFIRQTRSFTIPIAGNTFNQSLSATVTSSVVIQKVVNKIVSATSTSTAFVVKVVNKGMVANTTSTFSLVKVVNKNLTATVTSTATMLAAAVRAVVMSAGVTSGAVVQKTINKIVSASTTSTASISKVVNKSLSTTATSTASIVKTVNKKMTATLTSTASVVKTVNKLLSAGASSIASLVATFVAGSGPIIHNLVMSAGVTVAGKFKMLVPFGSGGGPHKISLLIDSFNIFKR